MHQCKAVRGGWCCCLCRFLVALLEKVAIDESKRSLLFKASKLERLS